MAKRWSQKAKKQLILDSIHAAIPILRLQNWQIEVEFDNKNEFRATCEASTSYKTATVSFAVSRIRIFECVEFAVHELAHAVNWPVATALEKAADAGVISAKEAEDLYEEQVTELAHIAVPRVLDALEAVGKLPPEAKEQPAVVIKHESKKRYAKVQKTTLLDLPSESLLEEGKGKNPSERV